MNPDTVLGPWDSAFLRGVGGGTTKQPWTSVPADLTSGMLSDLTNVGDPRRGPWAADGDGRHRTNTPDDARGYGSVGGLDDDGKRHHQDLWKPDHH